MIKTINNCRKLFLMVTLFLSASLVAQAKEIKGKVIGVENSEPIEGVVIINTKNNKYTVTNEEGDFLISIDLDDELQFNHINYQTQQHIAEEGMLIRLETVSTELEEILVFNRPLYDVFSMALKGTLETVEKGDLYKTYVREFNIVDNKQINVADGLVDCYVKNPTKRPLTDVVEHRVFNSSKDIDRDAEVEETLGVIGVDARDALIKSVDLATIEKIIKDTDSYELMTRKKVELNGEEKIIVEFEPKQGLEGWRYEQGYVIFDESLTKVLEYRYKLSDAYKEKSKMMNLILAKVQIYDYGRHVVFLTNENSDYRLSYSTGFIDFTISAKRIGKHRLHVLQEVVVDDVIKNVEIPKQKQFKGSLFKEKSNYTTEFWKNRNIRPLSIKEQAILNQLEEIKN